MNDKATNKSESDKWRRFEPDEYRAGIASLVHFSFKTVNSNAPGGGVRLAQSDALKLPYVAARCLMAASDPIALDYIANAGATATVVKQTNAIAEDRAAQAGDDEIAAVEQALGEARASRFETGTEAVSIRLRQLLIPRDDGYVALTPLAAGGVCKTLRQRLRDHDEARRDAPKDEKPRRMHVPTAVFGIGGANPQNVGALVRDMQRPMVFFPPRESRSIKRALALHYNGMALQLPEDAVTEYRQWREGVMAGNGGRIPTDMHTRDEEIAMIVDIVRRVLAQARTARRDLEEHAAILPGGGDPLVAPDADPLSRGLLVPELRDRDWPYAFARVFARKLADYPFRDGRPGLNLDQGAVDQLGRWIEETLR